MESFKSPSWLNRAEYPFESHYYQSSAGAMHYIDEGSGPPIVFVHGNPSWSFEFRSVIKLLSSRYRCIAPDHIGFGLSDKPENWTYLPGDHARNLEEFLESLNLSNCTFVVGDWGGPIGLSYAIKHPDKTAAALITNTWLWSAETDIYYRAFSAFMGGAIGSFLIDRHNFFARTMVPMLFGDKKRLTSEIHKHYIMPLGDRHNRKGCRVFPKQIIGASRWLQSLWESREAIAGKKIAIAWGMKDIAFREKELNTWTGAFPHARVTRLADAGHFVAEEKPREIAGELRTLTSRSDYGENQ